MKSSIKHGGILRCDMVHVDAEDNWSGECDEKFVTYSVYSIVREQAAGSKWVRPKAGHVKWPGKPPCDNAKKVDLCPKHATLVMAADELKLAKEKAKAERKAARELARAERKAERRAAKVAAKKQKPKKPRAPRKATAEATA